ncbi:Ppx/GppA phosphatase family protein [Melioribacter sp. OK-6-Me]|uniref:Ppx/GppA phosphatase family protein n=1 Tax=unclassified Melioribacter TaxID=2627329 RepID=UPI003ED94784
MTVASIDLGSNTVLLLIAEVTNSEIKTIKNFYRAPRVSKNLKKGNPFPEENIDRLYSVLDEYKKIIDEHNCKFVLAAATNAFRLATNGNQIAEKISERYGWNLSIISGEEEARLSFLGAAYPFENDNPKSLIDIGGGSTEIIYGNKKEIYFKKSYPIGVVYLTEKYLKHNPPLDSELYEMENEVKANFDELKNISGLGEYTIAIAGTPTTLACIKNNIKVYDEEIVDKTLFNMNDINDLYNRLKKMKSVDILKNFGQVVEGREDLITAGTGILKTFMELLEIKELHVNSRGLRYGLIWNYLINKQNREEFLP